MGVFFLGLGGFFLSLMRIILNLPYFSLFKCSQGENDLLDGTSIYSDESYPSTGKMSYTDIPCLVSRGETGLNRMI